MTKIERNIERQSERERDRAHKRDGKNEREKKRFRWKMIIIRSGSWTRQSYSTRLSNVSLSLLLAPSQSSRLAFGIWDHCLRFSLQVILILFHSYFLIIYLSLTPCRRNEISNVHSILVDHRHLLLPTDTSSEDSRALNIVMHFVFLFPSTVSLNVNLRNMTWVQRERIEVSDRIFLVNQFHCQYMLCGQDRRAYPESVWSNIAIGTDGCKYRTEPSSPSTALCIALEFPVSDLLL